VCVILSGVQPDSTSTRRLVEVEVYLTAESTSEKGTQCRRLRLNSSTRLVEVEVYLKAESTSEKGTQYRRLRLKTLKSH